MWFKHFMLSLKWRTKSFLPFKHIIVAINFTAILFERDWHLDKSISFILIFPVQKWIKKVKFMDVSFLFRGIGWPFVIQKLNWRKKVVRIDIKWGICLWRNNHFLQMKPRTICHFKFSKIKKCRKCFFRCLFSNY